MAATDPCLATVTDPAVTESYAALKARHEQRCARLLSPRCYLEIIPVLLHGGGPVNVQSRQPFRLSRPKDMLRRYRHLSFYRRRGERLYRHSFIRHWLRDKAARTLDAVVCNPALPVHTPRVFNTFRGFRAAALPPVCQAQAWAFVTPILEHIKEVLIPYNTEALGLVLDWFAHQLQRPAVRTRLALVLVGGIGCGKDFLPTWHAEHVVGPLYSEVLFRPSEARHVTDSILVLARFGSATQKSIPALRDLLLRYNCNKRHSQDENYSNVLVTTQSTRFHHLTAPYREFLTFHCGTRRQADHVYFASLRDYLMQPKVIRAWYQVLMARDLSSYRDTRAFQLAADALCPWRPPAECEGPDPSSDSEPEDTRAPARD